MGGQPVPLTAVLRIPHFHSSFSTYSTLRGYSARIRHRDSSDGPGARPVPDGRVGMGRRQLRTTDARPVNRMCKDHRRANNNIMLICIVVP